jgi:hypothetical protein
LGVCVGLGFIAFLCIASWQRCLSGRDGHFLGRGELSPWPPAVRPSHT